MNSAYLRQSILLLIAIPVAANAQYGPVSNTMLGDSAMAANTTGEDNTAIGWRALWANTTGFGNTVLGTWAMLSNTTGLANTATGVGALQLSTKGNSNTAIGFAALQLNVDGSSNTAIGYQSLQFNGAGNYNIAIGIGAARNVSPGSSNNIHIGSLGSSDDNGVIRIGTSSGVPFPFKHTSFYAAGIRGVTTGNNDGIPVMIDSNGQLGTVSSSKRYKEDIHDMGDTSSRLMNLRPVIFRYQKPFADGSKPVQYGLIAEEVAEVYPELVTRSADGQIETVKYQVLDSMLLNELQRQNQQIHQQAERILLLENRLEAIERLLANTNKGLVSTIAGQ